MNVDVSNIIERGGEQERRIGEENRRRGEEKRKGEDKRGWQVVIPRELLLHVVRCQKRWEEEEGEVRVLNTAGSSDPCVYRPNFGLHFCSPHFPCVVIMLPALMHVPLLSPSPLPLSSLLFLLFLHLLLYLIPPPSCPPPLKWISQLYHISLDHSHTHHRTISSTLNDHIWC